jgi:hypothetical protein
LRGKTVEQSSILRGSQNRPWGDGKWTCNERDERRKNPDRDDDGSHKKYLEDRMNPVRQIIRRSNAKHDMLASLRGLDLAKATAFARSMPSGGMVFNRIEPDT